MPEGDEVGVEQAADTIKGLLRRWRHAAENVDGAPVCHRGGDAPIVDEHAVEARLLKGIIPLTAVDPPGLVVGDSQVARGSQFPTLWGTNAKARYLDAMRVRRGRTPLAVELKVATGGQGRYYRRAVIQAVLYRHFIRNAADLEPWFRAADLDRSATQAVVAIPAPARWTTGWASSLDRLERLASRFDVEVAVVDDRKAPEWVVHVDLSEPTRTQIERLPWELVGALSMRWPRLLGRAVELHRGGGQYDEIQLQPLDDGRLDTPSPSVRISLNRLGSPWVWSQSAGADRWVWRGVWNYLAVGGGDVGKAAETIGSMAGFAPLKQLSPSVTFGEMAAEFLHSVPDADAWQWRCAWRTSDFGEGEAPGLERFAGVLSHYRQRSAPEAIPTRGRVWCAVRDNQTHLAVDQRNLRVWLATSTGIEELSHADPLERVTAAAKRL